jgi:hypothetical protein
MTRRISSWFSTALLCGALALPAIGCGDDSDDTTTEPEGGKGGSSTTGGKGGSSAGKGGSSSSTGGKGGSSAGKGGSGSAGKGGSSSAGGVMCGGQSCTVNSTLAMISTSAKACCTANDKCGQTNSAGKCMEQNAPGELDSKCPTVDVDFMGMNYPQMGCCTPKGKCGGLFMQVGYGCLAREDLQADQGGPLPSISCGSGASDADAGPNDAGM